MTAAEGRTARAAAALRQALADAQRLRHVQPEMKARLALAMAPHAEPSEFAALARAASEHGYALVARRARRLAPGK